MNIKRIVFWQNIISPHQVPYIRELPLLSNGKEILLVTAESISQNRLSLGWGHPDTGVVKVFVNPDAVTIDKLLSKEPLESVHVADGLAHKMPYVKTLLLARHKYRIRCGAIAEGADPRGGRGWLRKILYRYISFCDGNKWDFLVGMGELGEKWYLHSGWPLKKIYRFGYTTEMTGIPLSLNNNSGEVVKILFAGQLIHRKGVDILLKALAGITPKLKWELAIVGNGNIEPYLKILAEKLKIDKKVLFTGQLQNSAVIHLLQRSDLLVIPSRFDGWGAVINEAVMAGTPVLCSDQCGAKDLLTAQWRGEILESGNVSVWKDALTKWIGKGLLPPAQRQKIQKWSECINGISMGRYFLSVLENAYNKTQRPLQPWMDVY